MMLVIDDKNQKYLKARDALRRLANTDEGFTDVLTYLNGERLRLLGTSARSHNQTDMYREQGGALLLDSLFEVIREATR